jgi:integrase
MIVAARRGCGRLADRDAFLIMTAYRHGFRAPELIALRWDQIELKRNARSSGPRSGCVEGEPCLSLAT